MDKIYLVVTDQSTAEIEVIQRCRPDQLLVSFYYFHHKDLSTLFQKIGYRPKSVLADPGAYSISKKPKMAAKLTPAKYMAWIERNGPHIDRYLTYDVIGDPAQTFENYMAMKAAGFDPVPVFHFGSDLSWLHRYLDAGETYIALGGTVPIKAKAKVAAWVREIAAITGPDIGFHLLGSSSQEITAVPAVRTCDSSTPFMQAKNGRPNQIDGTHRQFKIARAVWLMDGGLEHRQCCICFRPDDDDAEPLYPVEDGRLICDECLEMYEAPERDLHGWKLHRNVIWSVGAACDDPS